MKEQEEYRSCKCCKSFKPLEDFPSQIKLIMGNPKRYYQYICKSCRNIIRNKNKKPKVIIDCKYKLKEQFISHRDSMISVINILGEKIPLDKRNLNDETCEYLIRNGYSFLFELSGSEEKVRVKKPNK